MRLQALDIGSHQAVMGFQSQRISATSCWIASALDWVRKAAGRPSDQGFFAGAWCEANECLVLLSLDHRRHVQVSTYRVHASGHELLGTWVTEEEMLEFVHLHVTAGAAELYFVQKVKGMRTCVQQCSLTGPIATHYLIQTFCWHYSPGLGLIGLSFGDLYICSPAGIRSVGLGCMQPLSPAHSDSEGDTELEPFKDGQYCAAGSWGSLTVVWRIDSVRASQQELLFLDLAHEQDVKLQHVEGIGQPLQVLGLLAPVVKVGRCSFALAEEEGQQVSVRALAGPHAGSELFRLWADCPVFEPLCGVFLAVINHGGGLSVMHGVTGHRVASWSSPAPLIKIDWIADQSYGGPQSPSGISDGVRGQVTEDDNVQTLSSSICMLTCCCLRRH